MEHKYTGCNGTKCIGLSRVEISDVFCEHRKKKVLRTIKIYLNNRTIINFGVAIAQSVK
jgi:hypothetical protein